MASRTKSAKHLSLLAILLVAAQGLALAHQVDEASHPARTVCDLCVAGQSLGAAAAASGLSWSAPAPANVPHRIEFVSPPVARVYRPGPRAPPISR